MCWCNRDIAVPCCGGIGCTPPERRPPPNLYDVDAHLELVLRCLANNQAGEAMRYVVGLRQWIANKDGK